MIWIEIPDGKATERERLWSLRPEISAPAQAFNDAVREHSILGIREIEAARMRIAIINNCDPCTKTRIADALQHGLDEAFYALLDIPEFRENYSKREQLAIEFAERFSVGKQAFNEKFLTDLKREFSPAEIFDLGLSVSKWLAFGRLNAVFGVNI